MTPRIHVLAITAGLTLIAAVTLGGDARAPRSIDISRESKPTLDLNGPNILFADSALSESWRALTTASVRTAQAIDPVVRGSYTFDPGTGLYTYRYTVENGPSATSAIWHFALAPIPNPIQVGSPSSAWDHYFGYSERDDALVWAVTDDGGTVPAVWDSVSLWPSAFDIQPGDSASGFFLTTPAPPSMVSYFVQGFYVVPPTNDEDGASDQLTLFQNSLTGMIVGPGSAVGVGGELGSAEVKFASPVPNPSAGKVSLTFYLSEPAVARVAIFGVSGRLLRVLWNRETPAGFQSISWDGFDGDGRRAPSGVYFYRLEVNGVAVGQQRGVIVP